MFLRVKARNGKTRASTQTGPHCKCSEGIITSLRNLLANTGMTQSQAMDALGIEQGERDKYAAMMA